MKIKFTKLEAVEGQRKDGTTWTGVKIHGRKYDGGDWSSVPIFHSDDRFQDALEELATLDKGTPVNIEHKKNGKFWDIISVSIGDDDVPSDPTPRSSGDGTKRSGGQKSGNSGGGNSMTKEEWAAKNEADRRSIAKSVALKAAVDSNWVTDIETTIHTAKQFEAYLLGEDGDPLDPPKV